MIKRGFGILFAPGLPKKVLRQGAAGVTFLGMEEVEKFFRCPYCHEKISMILDVSVDGPQTYIEDCEVCCRPIQVTYEVSGGKIRAFSAVNA